MLFNRKKNDKENINLDLELKLEEEIKKLHHDKYEGVEKEQEEKVEKKHPGKYAKKSKKPKPRKGLGEELIEVYESAGDELTSVTMLEHRRRTWQRMLIWILVFLVAVFIGVAGVSWLIWGDQQQFNGEQVLFDIDTSAEVSSGEEVIYTVEYANRESVSFRKAEIELRYPPGFIYESAEPEPRSGDNLWDLGSLNPGQDGTIEVTGYLVGRPDIDTTISGVFRYWPANFSSEFQEIASTQTHILAIDAELRVDGPDQILVGQTTSYSIVVSNSSEEELKDLQVEVIYPQDFVVEEAIPEAEEESIWLIETIGVDEEYEIQIDGYFSGASEEEVQLIVNLLQKGPDDDYFSQKEERVDIKLVQGDLFVNLIANGATKDSTIQWGDVITVSVNYENNSEVTLSQISAIVKIETRYRINNAEVGSDGVVDFSSLVDANNGSLKVGDNTDAQSVNLRTITWTEDDIENFGELGPDKNGDINFQFSLLSAVEAVKEMDHAEDAELVLSVEMRVGKTGGVEEEIIVASNPITFALDTDLVLDAHSRYYAKSGEEIGSGPIPPSVGSKTTYRIIWELTNSLHEVKDIIVSVQLPSNVAWVNQFNASAGEVEFTSGSNDLTWRLNKLPLDIEGVTLSFDVELNPKDTQIGEVAALTKKITLTSTDSITGGKIIQTISSLNTGIPRDEKGADKGLVVQ